MTWEKAYTLAVLMVFSFGLFAISLGLWELHRRKRKTQNP